MEQGLVHEGVTLEALGDAAKSIEPGKEPFHHPAVAGKFPVSVGSVFEVSVLRRSSQGNTVADATPHQREPKGLAVITPVSSQAAGAGSRAASSSGNLHLPPRPEARR
jgi:hypothetical protein